MQRDFDIDEYAERMARRADFAGLKMQYCHHILRVYEKTVNPDEEIGEPISRDFVYDNVTADKIDEILEQMPEKDGVDEIFTLYRVGSGVSNSVEECMRTFYAGHEELEEYHKKIHDVVEEIQEYDDEFTLDPDR